MKTAIARPMHPQLLATLTAYRATRRFDPDRYIDAKVALLNVYMQQSRLVSVVVGVSGGVDSAVTLGLVSRAAGAGASPIRRVVGALLPMFDQAGVTHQDVATRQGREVCRAFEVEPVCVDLSEVLAATRHATAAGGCGFGGDWAAGQLASYIRTPALYYQAALLAEQGLPALVCGTTNRDEGAYIGFFGKASDATVDVQLISDLHKSEVYALAEALGVPKRVHEAVPTGDTFDGRPDETMFGATYAGLELYTHSHAAGRFGH